MSRTATTILDTNMPALWRAARALAMLTPLSLAFVSTHVTAASSDPAALYHNYCSVCHGDNGDGRSRASAALVPPPRDFTNESARQELSRERIFAAIKYGRPGTAMVGWSTQLSDADMQQLTDYVLAQFVRRDHAGDPRGRAVYSKYCAVCHGDKGEGAVWAGANMARPPRNFAAAEAQTLTRDAMISAVTHGRPGTAMAGFTTQLSKDDIVQVVDYIRTALMASAISGTHAHGGREQDKSAHPAAPGVAAAFPNGLKGDARRGGAFYLANCATCHGARGDGAGPRAYFINPKPKSFIDEAARARYNRALLFAAVSDGRLGTEMPAWRQVINEQQIADVAEYVLQTFVGRPVAAGGAPKQAAPRP